MADKQQLSTAAYSPGRSRILNAYVDKLTKAELLERLDSGIVYTLNPAHLYNLQRDPEFFSSYRDASFVTVDSKYIYLALKLLGRPVPEVVTGSDFVPAFWKYHSKNPDIKIFLLGAAPGIAVAAQQRINRAAGREIVVAAFGPSMKFVDDETEIAGAIERINTSGATVLIVGLGSPKQENWISKYRNKLPDVKIFMGVGATIDYESGIVSRAPKWIRRLGMEWLHRIATQPRRYAWRYLKTTEFFWLTLLDALGAYRPPQFTVAPRQKQESAGSLNNESK